MASMNEILKILENPIRRQIIECLSQEPNYALQLSKNLGLGQQSIVNHLEIMEKSELVSSNYAKSPKGPRRKIFKLAKSFSIILDVAPHLFKQNIVFFDENQSENRDLNSTSALVEKQKEIMAYKTDEDKIKPISMVLVDIDKKLDAVENERVLLLSIRNSLMREASKIIQKIDNLNARRVFHQVLDQDNRNIEHISEVLNLREEKVKKLLQKLRDEFSSEYF